MPDLNKWFKKHQLAPENILYFYCKERKVCVFCDDGRELSLYLTMHGFLDYLPADDFINISKGVVVRRDRIVNISDTGVYTMQDGKTFQGRRRNPSVHRRLRKELGLTSRTPIRAGTKHPTEELTFLQKCTLLDNMPLAFCVIELVFNEDGRGVDFIFRYCNEEMAVVEGVPVERMLNHSFYEVFRNGDRKWLVTYADVALNGTRHTLSDYSPEIGKHLQIHCYQPEPGFCACVLQTLEN